MEAPFFLIGPDLVIWATPSRVGAGEKAKGAMEPCEGAVLRGPESGSASSPLSNAAGVFPNPGLGSEDMQMGHLIPDCRWAPEPQIQVARS